jgi:hypothetical protein
VPAHDTAYWLVASDGGIFAFGGAPFYGSMGGQPLNQPVVGMAGTATHDGYWEVAADGGIFSFGAAASRFYGSMGGKLLNAPVVGMAATPTGDGYWEVASDGGIFSFSATPNDPAAGFYGSMGGKPLNAPVVGMAATPTGKGYWEVASDGGIFSFGAAASRFYGSMGGKPLNAPIVSMAATATGEGYWLVASDGGIFAFGAAADHFYGSLGAQPLIRPIVAMSALFNGDGYWMTDDNGAVTNFGTATYWGSAPQHLNAPVVGMVTALGNGDPGSPSFQAGSTGYDISNWQCPSMGGSFPPAPHAIGIVEVEGASFGDVNPCLSTEVEWAGGGLNLYTFLTYGTTTASSGDAACNTAPSPDACNYGFNAALSSYDGARAVIGTAATVPWWLDIEGPDLYWTSTDGANQSVVEGAMSALRSVGINTVGFYMSLDNWNDIVGVFNPPGPLWVAWWTAGTPGIECTNARTYAAAAHNTLPSGPIELIQYTDDEYGFDGDYAC